MGKPVPASVVIALQPKYPANRKVAVVGDSRCANAITMSVPPNIHRGTMGWQHWLGILSKQRVDIDPTMQFATAGYTTEQVKPYVMQAANTPASTVIVFVGTNDRPAGFTATGAAVNDTLTNLAWIRDYLLGFGKIVVFVSETPRGSASFTGNRLSGTQLAYHLRTHKWIMDQDRQYPDVYAVDFWPSLALIGSASGDAIDGVMSDALHQSPEGAFRMADTIRPLIEYLYPLPSVISCSNADVFSADNPLGNFYTNPTMSGTAGTKVGTATGTVANNIQAGGTAGTVNTCDIFTDPNDGKPWQRMTVSGTATVAGSINAYQALTPANFVAGGQYQASCEMAVDTVLTNIPALKLCLQMNVNGTYGAVNDGYKSAVATDMMPLRLFSGVFRTPRFIIPAGAVITSPAFTIDCIINNGATISGAFRFRNVDIRRVA